MQMAGGYTPATNPNKRLYNGGSEWQDDIDGLADYYSTFFREYDAVIGRFNGVDPMAAVTDEQSTYVYSGNNPIMMNDPLGDISGGRYSQTDVALFNAILNWNNKYEVERMSTGMQNNYFLWHSTNYTSPWSWDGGIGGNGGGPRGGGWPTKGIEVHQFAIKMYFALKKGEKNSVNTDMVKIRALTDAALLADSDQSGASSYKHAMRNSDETPQAAMVKADIFVRDQFRIAKQRIGEGDLYNAYKELGLGLHALQDATSPSHYGFQLWSGNETYVEKKIHNIFEGFYPGRNSNLQKVTNIVIEWLENGGLTPLPSVNLFQLIEKDSFINGLNGFLNL